MNPPEADHLQDQFESLLLEAALLPDPGEEFDRSVLRQVRLDRHARTLKFWMPAILGALIAGVAVLSAVEVVGFSPARKAPRLAGQEARANPRLVIPEFQDTGATVEDR